MDAQVLRNLETAYAHQQRGDLLRAEPIYRHVLECDVHNIHALNLLGIICLNTDRASEAVSLIERAIKIEPDDPEAQTNLGLALIKTGDPEAAETAFRRAVALQPRAANALNGLGNIFLDRDDVQAAIRAYIGALNAAPNFADAHVNIARAYLKSNELSNADRAINNALKIDSRIAAAYSVRGDLYSKRCEYELARDAYEKALSLDPTRDDDHINFAMALKNLGETETALDAVSRLGEAHVSGLHALGQIKEQSGDLVGAEHAYEKAISLNARFAPAYYQLAQLKGRKVNSVEASAMLQLINDDATPADYKRHCAFGLALSHEQGGDYEQALDYFQKGHDLIAKNRSYDDIETERYHARITAIGAPGPAIASLLPAPCPIFVLGMPRSGTSLTEQILSSHPRIAGGGESSYLEDAVSQAKELAGKPFPECQEALTSDQLAEIGSNYRARLARGHDQADYVIDKTPLNFQYIGFATRILPDAKFIHCVRDPLDTCLSIYRLPFDTHQTYAHKLDALALFYRRYHALMTFWHDQLPGALTSVRYETLVGDLETEAKRLLQHVGVNFDPKVLNFHNQPGIVRTPSASQVRKPIYRDAIDRWKQYGDRMRILEPLQSLPPL